MIIQITESQDYSKKALAIYQSLGRVVFNSKPRKDASILVVGLKYQIDKSWLNEMPNLKLIASPATGLNHFDMKEIKKRGIKLISLRGRTSFLKNIPSTAEKTLALLLGLVRNLPWSFDDVKKGNWDRIRWRGRQLLGKTIGLLGFGRLGKIVAKYAKAFGMKVIAGDPYVSKKTMARMGVQKVSMEQVFKNSDFVSLHVLLTDETHNLVTDKHLKMMKPNAYLINTARGELIKKGSLEVALKNNWIAGAAIDVMWDEQGDGSHLENNPLVELARENNNLIIVPHIGGATYEAMEATQDFIAELVKKHFQN